MPSLKYSWPQDSKRNRPGTFPPGAHAPILTAPSAGNPVHAHLALTTVLGEAKTKTTL